VGVRLVQLVTSLPARDDAVALARAAVEARVAACGQVVGPVTSAYRWEGAVRGEEEHLLLLKVPVEGVDALAAFIRERHPYDTPELTALDGPFIDERYLAWARAETVEA